LEEFSRKDATLAKEKELCGLFKTYKNLCGLGLPAILRTRPQRWRVATAGWVALQAGELSER